MNIVFDEEQGAYIITIEYPDTEFYANTIDIVKTKEYFLDNMAWLFDEAVRQKFVSNIKD